MALAPGAWCERLLDGIGFPCKVVAVNPDGTFKLEFEDGFVEDDVPLEEVQAGSGAQDAESKTTDPDEPAVKAQVVTAELVVEPVEELDSTGATATKKDTTYIVHGAENNVAAGSGLKGVRWLRTQV